MKKIILVALLMVSVGSEVSLACEICGCGVGNFYLGMVPKYGNKFIGLRYRYTNYQTRMHDDPDEYSNDYYKTIEVWGGWNFSSRWQVISFLPYQINRRVTDNGEKTESGLSDIIVITNYNIWNHSAGGTKQQLWLGGGVKLPTGKYEVDFSNPDNNLGDPNGQTGTGSVDFLINASHVVSFKKWGLNTTLSYKINSVNSDDFKFGNRGFVNTLAYYQWQAKDITISPVVGAMYEVSNSNQYQNEIIEMTGGNALFASTGIEVSAKIISVGFTLQSPMIQNFSDDQTQVKPRGLVHMTFTF